MKNQTYTFYTCPKNFVKMDIIIIQEEGRGDDKNLIP
jgi:hypothetical protein